MSIRSLGYALCSEYRLSSLQTPQTTIGTSPSNFFVARRFPGTSFRSFQLATATLWLFSKANAIVSGVAPISKLRRDEPYAGNKPTNLTSSKSRP